MIENPAGSDIFTDSPLARLRDDKLNFSLSTLDQCACGGQIDGQFIRKRTHFQCSHKMHHLDALCPGGHTHLHLVGGHRAASSAVYPEAECKRILQDARMTVHQSGGALSALDGGSMIELLSVYPDFYSRKFPDKIAALADLANRTTTLSHCPEV